MSVEILSTAAHMYEKSHLKRCFSVISYTLVLVLVLVVSVHFDFSFSFSRVGIFAVVLVSVLETF